MRFPFRSPARAHAGVQPPRPRRRWLRRRDSTRGQTMVEVGLVLPIFILTIVAVLEMGYYAAVASAVNTASREGARFGSTVDCIDGNCEDSDSPQDFHFLACDEIRVRARDMTDVLVNLEDADIEIRYEADGGGEYGFTCDDGPDEDDLARWDRVVIEVTYTYSPITPIVGPLIGERTLTSIDRRSIVKP